MSFGFAVTFALVMLRLLTWPVAPMVPNMPMLMLVAPGATGAMVRLLMVRSTVELAGVRRARAADRREIRESSSR